MAGLTPGAPSSHRFSHFYCEQAVVVDVNRVNWTCSVQTQHSAKLHKDVQWGTPYHHYLGGEGIHIMPEVGARCYVASPVDQTPRFIMAFIAPPGVRQSSGDTPARSTSSPGGSSTDVTYQSNRPDFNPGDIGITTRDGNFLMLRRGGVVQIGATPLAQRVIVPVRNYVHDFFENYEMASPAGDLVWSIDRPELDPAGKAPASWVFHLNEFATDKKASVRVRHLPSAEGDAKKAAWEVTIAPQGIDRDGKAEGTTYSLSVLLDGTFAEVIAASRSIDIKGDDTLTVEGVLSITAKGDAAINSAGMKLLASKEAVIAGSDSTKVGDEGATEPAMLGDAFMQWAQNCIIQTPTGPGLIHPTSVQALQDVLSKKVFIGK